MNAVVIINTHEPEGEVATRLLELAEEKGYEPADVVAQRGEHDSVLSFRVPQDVADAFDAERADRWPNKIENDGEKTDDQEVVAGVNGDAYAADQAAAARAAAAQNAAQADDDNDPNTPVRKTRAGKAKE
jgi:hypothetical protein